MFCTIWYLWRNLKNMKNVYEGLLLFSCNFTKISTPLWEFFTFFKLYKWYQIAQRDTYSEAVTSVVSHLYFLNENYRYHPLLKAITI